MSIVVNFSNDTMKMTVKMVSEVTDDYSCWYKTVGLG